MLTWTPEDRPLFVQFCSNDPQHLLAAARMVEKLGMCDAIDINFGCPQVGAWGQSTWPAADSTGTTGVPHTGVLLYTSL